MLKSLFKKFKPTRTLDPNHNLEYRFEFKLKNGNVLSVKNTFNGVWFEGGKRLYRDMFLKQIIEQAAEKGLPGLILDAAPIESSLSQFTEAAFKKYADKHRNKNLNFSIFDLSDAKHCVRVNPFSLMYIENFDDVSLGIETFYCNLSFNDDCSQFWKIHGLAYLKAIAFTLYEDVRYAQTLDNFNLPLIISIASNPISIVLRWIIKENEHCFFKFMEVFSAIDNDYKESEINEFSPFSNFINKEVFWMLSADEFNLDTTNILSPSLLILKHSDHKFNAVYSVVMTTVLQQMNQTKRHKSLLLINELPYKLPLIDGFLATSRKRGISKFLFVGKFKLLEKIYDHHYLSVISVNFSTKFFSYISDPERINILEKQQSFLHIREKASSLNKDDAFKYYGYLHDDNSEFFEHFASIEYDSILNTETHNNFQDEYFEKLADENFNSILSQAKEILNSNPKI